MRKSISKRRRAPRDGFRSAALLVAAAFTHMTSAESMDALLKWIEAKQNPPKSSCHQLTHYYRRGSGLGSQLLLMAHQMLEVLQHGGIFEVVHTHTAYANPRVCPGSRWGCYVRPLTHCPVNISTDVTVHAHVSCSTYNASFWSSVGLSLSPPARLGSGVEFFLAGIIQYILRPTPFLQHRIAVARNRTGLRAGAACVAVHARLGDTTIDRSRAQGFVHPALGYALLARQLAVNGDLHQYFVNSDSPSLVAEITKHLNVWGVVFTMPADMFPLYSYAAAGHEVALAAARVQGQLQKQQRDEHAADEGAALLAQVILSSGCPAYVASLASNVNRLAAGLRLGRQDRIADMDGGAWFACTTRQDVSAGGPSREPTQFIPFNATHHREQLLLHPCRWTKAHSCS